jgi:hypothetical protein
LVAEIADIPATVTCKSLSAPSREGIRRDGRVA